MRREFCSIAFALLILQTTSGHAQPPEVLVGTGEFPPFTTETTADQGCVIQIVKSAFEAEGWNAVFKFMPWPRNRKMLLEGSIEASAYWLDRPDRRREYVFPDHPVTSEVYRFIFRRDSEVEWETFEDLSEEKIILNSDYTYNEAFWKAIEQFNIKHFAVKSEDLNLKMLLKGRGSLTIMNEDVYRQYIDQLTEEQQSMLIVDTKIAVRSRGFLLFSKEHPQRSLELVQVFDRGYEKVRGRDDLRTHFETCGF